MIHDEDTILSAFAQRFAGYTYMEESKYDPRDGLNLFINQNSFSIIPEEHLALFFWLQRGIYTWNLAGNVRNDKHWKTFRTLFLLTGAYDISPPYRDNDNWPAWQREYGDIVSQCLDTVRLIHAKTNYIT
ncbi:MAG: hypothetical protein GY868_00420 [Deltaproteobacteria bacterium]|nr:hypothetical protein [Deltaproteobacteria bacterium]